ncbi:MAG TPA: CPBP family intramembrane glutamic endopeptidase [Candidatus Bathyarchaeia archaeon]|nr:CPBP family intramembrane glutamic endopeptidase [Candidatus Bathyarchaeia archaeon]
MPPETPLTIDTPLPQARDHRLLAPMWHTAIVLFVLLGASLGGAHGIHPLTGHSRIPQYLWTISWEWLVAGFIYLGIRKRITLRELIGGRWANAEAFLLDMAIAAGFWLLAMLLLGAGAKLMHLDQGDKLENMRHQIGFLIPRTKMELLVWFLLSTTAGICEEIIFRGYLQRQFAAATRSMPAGVLLSAVVFGAAHGYEGGPRMVLIGFFGLMFGLLAWWRRSLRPGMIAHAWHDAISGALLRVVK